MSQTCDKIFPMVGWSLLPPLFLLGLYSFCPEVALERAARENIQSAIAYLEWFPRNKQIPTFVCRSWVLFRASRMQIAKEDLCWSLYFFINFYCIFPSLFNFSLPLCYLHFIEVRALLHWNACQALLLLCYPTIIIKHLSFPNIMITSEPALWRRRTIGQTFAINTSLLYRRSSDLPSRRLAIRPSHFVMTLIINS